MNPKPQPSAKEQFGSSKASVVLIGLLALAVGVLSFPSLGSIRRLCSSTRVSAEIKAIGTACEAYLGDRGTYPRSPGCTEQMYTGGIPPIDPRIDFDPRRKNYRAASLFLYEELSGDLNHDGVTGDEGRPVYFPFSRSVVSTIATPGGLLVQYIQDPYGCAYGYSTAGSKDKEDDRAAAATSLSARRFHGHGFNTTFDLWSTGGSTRGRVGGLTHRRWTYNW